MGTFWSRTVSSTYALHWEHGEFASLFGEMIYSPQLDHTYWNMRVEAQVRRKLPILGDHTVVTARVLAGTSLHYEGRAYAVGGSSFAPANLWRPWSQVRNAVRGYPTHTQTGDHYYSSSATITFPLRWLGFGYATFPFYFRRLSAKLFVDFGQAISTSAPEWDPLLGVGGEIRLHMVQGYEVQTDISIGVSRGVDDSGDWMWYIQVGSPLPQSIFQTRAR